jgi:hypothetical protein
VLKTLFQFLVITLGNILLPVVCLGESFTVEQVLSAPFPYGLTSATHAPRVAWVFDNKGERNILPDEVHDLLRWTAWVRSCKATADFFDRKLAATPQPR